MESLSASKPGPAPRSLESGVESTAPQYFNRELSLLQFNRRVLQLARDPSVPILERLRFLAISTANLDEFFEIRVAGLKEHLEIAATFTPADGWNPADLLGRISDAAHELVREQYQVLNDEIFPALSREGIRVLKRSDWTKWQADWIRGYFERQVLPVLSPVGLDPAHPFPKILNKSLNFIVSLKGKDAFGRSSRAAVVQAPRLLPRLIQLPEEVADEPYDFVMLSSIIHAHVGDLFMGMKVKGCFQFRVTRNSDLWVEEEEVDDLLSALKGELLSRRFGAAVRLEVADNCTDEMQAFLLQECGLRELDLYRVDGPVNLHRLSALYDLVDRPDLKYRPFLPGAQGRLRRESDVFATIRSGDVLLHHPFQSFAPVVEFLREAARDPDVIALKQTLYRTGTNSPLVDLLLEAAKAGKEVTAVIELRARFDEAANIDLATRLQAAGAKVVYGVVGYKTHVKMLLVVRREGETFRRYVHLSTGNYHTGTSRAYTDWGLLSCDESLGEDVHRVFLQLTGLGKVSGLNKVLQAPFNLHTRMLELIEQEGKNALAGRPARIIAKMNSLIDTQIIQALYRASQAGVQIDLIVRGICCLRPGVEGLSANIRVRSVLGRFLEHSRVFYFLADGEDLTYLSSADWMPRNFFRRVEICFPIESKRLRRQVMEDGLLPYLADNTDAWILSSDGTYARSTPKVGEVPFTAQRHLLETLSEDVARGHDRA
ncbi:MAG: polyphosphate kinase 1 [Planctomycetota bacterium]